MVWVAARRPFESVSLADQVQYQFAVMRCGAVFEQVDGLPGTQQKLALVNRDCQLGLGQC